jgi:apolipoprotein N-acyltransferase
MRRGAPLARFGVQLATAVALGLLQAASIASPWDGNPQGWLQVASLAGLVALLHRSAGAGRAAALGWAFGTAWLSATWWWLYVSMHTYGGLPAPLAALAVLALAAFLASYYGVLAGVFRRFAALAPARTGLLAIIFAACWLLAELLRGHWFTGFPWGAAGYAHLDGWARPLAGVMGVYGLSALAALVAALLALWLPARPLAAGAVAVAAGALAFLPAPDSGSLATAQPLPVALLQGNIPQDEKFQPGTGVPQALQWYGEQLAGTRAALTVAPETAIPLLPQQIPEYWAGLQRRFATGTQAALVGVPRGDLAASYFNAVAGFAPGQPGYTYDKHHLVPFGEFIPTGFRWFTQAMRIPLGDFSRGAVAQPSFAFGGERLAPNVCYEDLFGEELAARFADPAAAPTVFVNVSNIGWFGDTVAIDQHLHIARMRSLEFARPTLRATNTGATVVIDHRGAVQHRLPPHVRGVLHAEVQGRKGLTPYARWVAAAGLAPLWLLALAVLANATWRARRWAAAP